MSPYFFIYMTITIDNYTLYIIQNILIVLFLLNCWFWTLTNNNNIFQKILSLPLIRDYVLYFGLWHGWNMFINPSRTNSLIYANVKFFDNSEKLIEIFNPAKRFFLGTRSNMRDVKYMENIIFDNNNYIKPMFCDFLADYAGKSEGKFVQSMVLLHNYTIVEDFFTKYKHKEEMKELYRWSR